VFNNGGVGTIYKGANVYAGGVFNNNRRIENDVNVYDGGVFNNNANGAVIVSTNIYNGSEFNNNGFVLHANVAGGVFNNINNGNVAQANVYDCGVFNNDGIFQGNAFVSNGGVFNNNGTMTMFATVDNGTLNNEATGRIERGVTLRGESGELVHNGWISGDVNVEGGQLSGNGRIDGTLHIASGGMVDTAVFTGMINKLILDEGGTLVFNLDLLNGDFSTLNFAPEPELAPFSIMSVFGSGLLSNSDLMELNGTVLINILNDDFVDAETKNEAQSLLEELFSSLNIDPTTPEIFSNWSVQSANYLVSIGNDGTVSFEEKGGGGPKPPATPEPATLLLIGLGLAGLPIIRKRMRQ